jgi:hypothetical protein
MTPSRNLDGNGTPVDHVRQRAGLFPDGKGGLSAVQRPASLRKPLGAVCIELITRSMK